MSPEAASAQARLMERLAARSRTLDELRKSGETSDLSTERLTRWKDLIARGDSSAFAHRLDWDTQSSPESDHGWQGILEEACESIVLEQNEETLEDSVPFEAILRPLVRWARMRLESQSPSGRLGKTAWDGLAQTLLRQLSVLSRDLLVREFDQQRQFRSDPISLTLASLGGAPSRAYRGFVDRIVGHGYESILDTYPVWGRLVGKSLQQWIQRCGELIVRLESDWDELTTSFCHDRPPSRVTSIEGGLSDPHLGGASVHRLRLDGDVTFYYKPRSLALEVAFLDLLTWLNGREAPLEFGCHVVIDKGRYGWVESVDASPVHSEQEARRAFERQGALLSLLHVLGSSDCHYENLVQRGESPFLIDMETVLPLDPVSFGEGEGESRHVASRLLQESVLASGMFPTWIVPSSGGAPIDVGGLTGGCAHQRLDEVWKNLGTDAVGCMEEEAPRSTSPNVVRLGERELDPRDYRDWILRGFDLGYRFLMGVKDDLLAKGSPLERLVMADARFVFRPTHVYSKILARSRTADCLRDGVSYSLEHEALGRPFVRESNKPPQWALFEEERRSLSRGDVPWFLAIGGTRDLAMGDRVHRDYFRRTPKEIVEERLSRLSEGDRQTQRELIEAGLEKETSLERLVESDSRPSPDGDWGEVADDLATQVASWALQGHDGDLAWIGRRSLDGGRASQLAVLGEDLYTGRMGIGLMFASLAWGDSQSPHRKTALQCLSGLAHASARLRRNPPRASDAAFPLGGILGLGATVYGLIETAELLSEPSGIEEAHRASELLDEVRISHARESDVVSGLAGLILALLRLHNVRPEANRRGRTPLELAAMAGEELLERRRGVHGQPRAWPACGSAPLAGFSHGTSGIALAMAKLSGVTSDHRFVDAAREGLDYERTLYSPEHGNWIDTREGSRGFPSSWCHGAPGIVLARLELRDWIDDERLERELEAALKTTMQTPSIGHAPLCCGDMGRACILDRAARQLGRDDARVRARDLLAKSLRHLEERGPRRFEPSLFRGVSGIVYAIIRIMDQDRESTLKGDVLTLS